MGAVVDRLQKIQAELSALQMGYRDSTPRFWALGLAWESARFAWYVCAGDDFGAREKLGQVRQAVDDVARFFPEAQGQKVSGP